MIVVTLILLLSYLLLLKGINRGHFVFSPIGIHALFLSAGIVLPAIYLRAYEPMFEVGVMYMPASGMLLRVLDMALIGLSLGAVTAIWFCPRPSQHSGFRDDVPRQRVCGMLIAVFGLTAFFFYNNADLYRTLFTEIWHTTDVFDLIQDTRIDALYGSTYAIQGVTRVLPLLILLLFSRWYISGNRALRQFALILLVCDFACLFVVGIRATQICVLVQLGLLRNYFKPFRSGRVLLYGATICTLLIFGTALKFGFGFSDSGILFSEVLTHVAERISLGAKHLQYVLALFPAELEHRHGMTYVQDFVSLIPSPLKRSIFSANYWLDFNGFLYQRLYGYEGGTTTDTLIGEFYANFGFVGVGVGSFLYGFVLQTLSTRFAQQAWRESSRITVAIFLSYYLAQSTIEGLGETFFVSALWATLFYLFLFPSRVLAALTFHRTQDHTGSAKYAHAGIQT